MSDSPAAILIFTWGNPSRGDDALGPEIYQRLLPQVHPDIDLLTDFQLQIEHSVDLENRQCILFVDASVSVQPPFEFIRVQPEQDDSYSTHAVSPQSLLSVYEKVNRRPPPPAYLIAVRGYQFDLGLPLSSQAHANLEQAIDFIRQLLSTDCNDWNQLVTDINPAKQN